MLLHGATLDHRSWTPQITALQDRFHVVVPDLRAHGQSTGHFDFDAAVDDVLALLERLPAAGVVLVGLSLGGNLAQEVVRRTSDRVHALVIADATCNTAVRHPLAASLTVAALTSHAMLPGDHYARHAAGTVAVDPQVQRYALEVNATARTGRPAAGHASNLDNSAAFTAALLAFLDRVLRQAVGVEEPSPEERTLPTAESTTGE